MKQEILIKIIYLSHLHTFTHFHSIASECFSAYICPPYMYKTPEIYETQLYEH